MGIKLAVTGHRPNKMYGYDLTNVRWLRLKERFKELLVELDCEEGFSGMALGVDWDNFPFNDKILVEYNKAYQALRLDSIVRNRQLDKPLFNDVMTRFIDIVKGLRRESDYVTWSHEKERFV